MLRDDDLMPFGKHKDTPLQDVPDDYLRWCANQEFVEEDYPELFAYISHCGLTE